jgi:surface protein
MVTDMSEMFDLASSFEGDLSSFNVSSVINMFGIFYNASAFDSSSLSSWDTSVVRDMSWMFAYTPFNRDISAWNTGAVQDMSYMFYKATRFNADISSWNVGLVQTLEYCFYEASSFNAPIGSWDVGSVTNMD